MHGVDEREAILEAALVDAPLHVECDVDGGNAWGLLEHGSERFLIHVQIILLTSSISSLFTLQVTV